MPVNSEEIYQLCRFGGKKYKEEVHCPMIVEVMNNQGTMAAFCTQAQIGDSTFYNWMNKHPVFHECYRIGCMIARNNWEEEGEKGKYDEEFNIDVWKIQGASRYGIGRTNRVRLHIDAKSTPYEQYQQLVNQATLGEFSAAEFKQLVEGVNIGLRAYEVLELQKEIDEMKDDLNKMSANNGNNLVSIAKTS